jgi:hypothetical protein
MRTNNLRTELRYAWLACLTALAAACSTAVNETGLRLGEPVPDQAAVTQLAEVLADPAAFNDARVVLKGVVASQCSSLCHFNFQDGVHSVTVYPQGFKLPRLQRGRGITLFAHVYSGEGQVAFSVLGLHME